MTDVRRGFCLGAGLVALAGGVVTGCGGTTASWHASDSPAKALQAANRTSMNYTTARTTVHGAESMGAQRVPIDLQAVTNFRDGTTDMSVQVASLGRTQARIVDGTLYEKIPDDAPSSAAGSWLSVELSDRSGGSAGGDVSGGDVLGMLRGASLASVKRSGHSKVNGRSTTEFDGVLDVGRVPDSELTDATSGFAAFLRSLELGTMPTKVYVDKDGLVRRVVITAKNEHGSVDLTTDYLEYGVPLHVTAPPADQVMPYSSVQEVLGQNTSN